jgi:hypothetical protein
MARKPTDYVQVKIRMREALRRKLEREAEKKKHSANNEALERIEWTFRQEEEWEEQQKWMDERHDEQNAREEAWFKAEAQREAEYKAALRDSQLLTRLAGSDATAEVLRFIVIRFGASEPEWAATAEGRKTVADEIHSYIMSLGKEDQT